MITTNNKKGNKRSRFEEFKAKLMADPKSGLKGKLGGCTGRV